MAVEALLPSEVARLVYGYLIEEKCNETAQSFLNESPNLLECRTVLSYGRHFTTRVCGLALLDILEKFCLVNTIVQEKLQRFENLDKAKHCGDLVRQIKFLLEQYRNLPVISENKSAKCGSSNSTISPTKCHKKHSSFSKDENKSKQITQISDNSPANQNQAIFNQIQTNSTTEATLLKNLPGYIDNSKNEKSESHFKIFENLKASKESKNTFKADNIIPNGAVNKNTKLQEMKNESKTLEVQRCNGLNKNIISSTNDNVKINKNFSIQNSNIKTCNMNDIGTITDVSQQNPKHYIDSEVQTSFVIPSCSKKSLPVKNVDVINETPCVSQTDQTVSFIGNMMENRNQPSNTVSKINIDKNVTTTYKKDLLIESQDNLEIKNLNKNEENFHPVLKENILENVNQVLLPDTNITKESTISKAENIEKINKPTSTQGLFTNPVEIEQDNLIKDNFKVPTNEVQNNLQRSTKNLLHPLVSPILQQNNLQKTDSFFTHNNTLTSTPIKTNSAMQNFYSCDWFTTQDLPLHNIFHQKEDTAVLPDANFVYTCTASESVVTSTTPCFSPIISKDITMVAEITTLNYATTNTCKDQSLHTPVVTYSSKASHNITPPLCTYSTIKNKTPVFQKSSETSEDKTKVNLNSPSTLLKSNSSNEYNRYFSLESIKLYNLDANSSTVQPPVTIPEIEVDGALSLSGLTPYLKINKPSSTTAIEQNKNLEDNIISIEPEEFVEEIKKNESSAVSPSAVILSEIITKNTPKTLLENRMKNNRLSLSTPKKSSNYVRALNFDTPFNKSYSESKSTHIKICLSPETLKRNHNKSSCKSSLFQSPTLTNTEIVEQKTENFNPREVFSDFVKPVSMELDEAQNSINKKLSENDNKILKNASLISKNSKDSTITGTKENTTSKESWDSKLRKNLGQLESTVMYKRKSQKSSKEEKRKHDTPKKAKKKDKSTPKKVKKEDKMSAKKSKKSEKNTSAEKKMKKKDMKTISATLKNETKIKLGAPKNQVKIDDTKILKNNDKIEHNTLKSEFKVDSNFLENDKKLEPIISKSKSNNYETFTNNEKFQSTTSNNESKDKNTYVKDVKIIDPGDSKNKVNYQPRVSKTEKKIELLFKCEALEKLEKIEKIESNFLVGESQVEVKALKSEDKESKTSKNNTKVEFKISKNEEKTNTTDTEFRNSKSEVKIDTDVLGYNKKIELINVQNVESKEIAFELETQQNKESKFEVSKNELRMVESNLLNNEEKKEALKSEYNTLKSKEKSEEKGTLNSFKVETQIISEALKMEKDSLEMILTDNINEEIVNEDDLMMLASKEVNNLNKETKSTIKNQEAKEQEVSKCQELTLSQNTLKADIENMKKDLHLKHLPEKDLKTEKYDERDNKRIRMEESKSVDYAKIEAELCALTNSDELVKESSTQKDDSLYELVSKVESGGKVIEKKYARLTTLDTNIAQFVIDPETPRKDDCSLQIPPTPRVLSPSSTSLPPMVATSSKLNEDSRTFQSLVATPVECPLTPNIVLTPPKSNEENTCEESQKHNTSPYYESMPITFYPPKKSTEITQFEVIKENLLKDDKIKSQTESEKVINNESKLEMSYKEKSSDNCDSSSSSSSTSSSSCSSSSSSSSDEEDDSADLEEVPNKDEEVKEGNTIKNKGEISPIKVFTINKTDKELIETMKETPAKDENHCVEEAIFDTPTNNVSKLTENPTNLNIKISQIMILKEQEAVTKQQEKVKSKVINVERILPKVVTIPTTQLLKALPLNIQMKVLEVKNEALRDAALQKIKIDKSDEEVAQAVESIILNENEKFNKSINVTDNSIETAIASPVSKNESGTSELFRAIESITNPNCVLPEKSKSTDESGSEGNLELVLEDDEEDALNTPFKTIDEVPSSFSDNTLPCHEHHIIFNEETYKKKNRKHFTHDELIRLCRNKVEGGLHVRTPTAFDMMFVINPPRKRRMTKAQAAKLQTENLINDDVPGDGPDEQVKKTNNKRKTASEENGQSKRKKNMFIY